MQELIAELIEATKARRESQEAEAAAHEREEELLKDVGADFRAIDASYERERRYIRIRCAAETREREAWARFHGEILVASGGEPPPEAPAWAKGFTLSEEELSAAK